MKSKNLNGFTIAELVIAMIIIAGIAMILMPTLLASHEKQVFVTALQKTYTQLQDINQATDMLIARGSISATTTNPQKTFIDTVYETQKTVDFEKKDKNYFKEYNSKLVKSVSYEKDNTAVLKSGIIIMNDGNNIVVDVNGLKRPNVVGKDIYYFQITKETNGDVTFEPVSIALEAGAKLEDFPTNCTKGNFDTASNHVGCADYILNYKHTIDYY